jgi:hypothetical protein
VIWPQNHWDGFVRFGLKTGVDSFFWFGLKIGVDSFLWFGLKTGGDSFSGLTSKPVVTISWLRLKINVVQGFSIWTSKPTITVW